MQPQPQADARSALLLDAGRTVKSLEEMRLLLDGEARPLIVYLDQQVSLIRPHHHDHLGVVRRVFERVGQIVGNDLPNTVGVTYDRGYQMGLNRERNNAVWPRDALLAHRLTDNRQQVTRFRAHFQPTRLYPRDVYQII